MEQELKWYIVYTRARWEKKVADQLSKKDIDNYCPVNRVLRHWYDRKKMVYEPLFASYVFIRTTYNLLSYIKEVNGVINFVYWLGKPAIIQEDEIKNIRLFSNDYENIMFEKTDVNLRDRVHIIEEPMNTGARKASGETIRIKLILPSLGYVLSATVQRPVLDNVILIHTQRQVSL
jgi:transcription antitermination factor NusG